MRYLLEMLMGFCADRLDELDRPKSREMVIEPLQNVNGVLVDPSTFVDTVNALQMGLLVRNAERTGFSLYVTE